MAKRKIIKIDEGKCNGCGLCIPNCPEGALQIIDAKARLVSDLFCDGLGACIGHCPQGAITIEEREAGPYDERKVMENIVRQGGNVVRAHLEHLQAHNASDYLKQALEYLKEKGLENPLTAEEAAHNQHHACPGSKIMDFRKNGRVAPAGPVAAQNSQLGNWPVQLMLVPAIAPFLEGADLLIAADCVPFTYADFHQDLLKGKVLLVGCPKLDNLEFYRNKFTQIFKNNNIKSVTYARMEVPCCTGMIGVIQEAIRESGKDIPLEEIVISIKGERLR